MNKFLRGKYSALKIVFATGVVFAAISFVALGCSLVEPTYPLNQIVSEEYCVQNRSLLFAEGFSCVELLIRQEFILVESNSPLVKLSYTTTCDAPVCTDPLAYELEALADEILENNNDKGVGNE